MIGNDIPMGSLVSDKRMAMLARELALKARCRGLTRLHMPSPNRLSRTLTALRRYACSAAADTAWFMEHGRLLEAQRDAAPRDRLPACGGLPRIQHLTREMVRRSDALISPERLVSCAQAYNETREMTMAELWLLPAALKAEIMRLIHILARQTLRAEKEREKARAWVRGGATSAPPARISPIFAEQALSIARAGEDDELRARVEKALSNNKVRPAASARWEYERQGLVKMYLTNALTTLRNLENLDWQEVFAEINAPEKTLLEDPSGTYPAMDEDSRAALRRRLADMARETGLFESRIAEEALNAAEDGEGLQGEICYWLYEDEGRRALCRRLNAKPVSPMVPDPHGRRFLTLTAMLCILLAGMAVYAGTGISAVILALPPLWAFSARLAGRFLAKPGRGQLLRLESKTVPRECRTLVVIPALLSSVSAAREAAKELHTLACLTGDENVDFLLLGDLPAASAPTDPADEGILAAARQGIDSANRALERPKCYVLTRPRTVDVDGDYTARERKRGALEDLNRLLMGEGSAFDGDLTTRAYRFVLTLDLGTRLLPDALTALIGAMAHPLNQKYAILQPRMEAELARTPFARRMAGEGGCDTYEGFVSDAWQSLTGEGLYGGKGIYDVARFSQRLAGRIRPNTVLSHDLLEGLFARCGYLGSVALYESFPGSARAWLDRLHRWTRGDWQLLPYLRAVRGAARKYRILSNLISELVPVSLLALLLLAALTRRLPPAILALALGFARVRAPFSALLHLTLLPAQAYCILDAAVRGLWRAFVSHRRILEWKTARDAERGGGSLPVGPFFACAGLAAAGLPASLPLCILWACAPWIIRRMEREKQPAQTFDIQPFRDLAAATWRYFEQAVTPLGLPRDNIQLDPPTRPQNRTSPTNIGLYMASCAAAWRLDLISKEEALSRVETAVQAVEGMSKWRGHLYNWHDAESGKPLSPRYVSSVDSGNLAACLLYVSAAFSDALPDLSLRLTALAEGMDFAALFDPRRKLFYTGIDGETGKPGASRYDLLASEARLLYYVSAMLGKTPVKSWRRLSRAHGRLPGGDSALLSWSGTMFEYLMPDLFLAVHPRSLLGRTRRSVIRRQIGAGKGAPFWGVSESGCADVDGEGQYQYRAFGLDELALRGNDSGGVYAPYASLLACEAAPEAVADNLRAMEAADMLGELGLYEAVDHGRIVKSHMSHHQGMILLALCNLLTDGSVRRDFMSLPRAGAVSLLLEEKPARGRALPARRILLKPDSEEEDYTRRLHSASGAGGHLLYGGGTTMFLTSTGAGFASHNGVLLNRRGYDCSGGEGFYTHVLVNGEDILASGDHRGSQCAMDECSFRAVTRLFGAACTFTVCVSPEDGAICREVSVRNETDRDMDIEITDAFAVCMSPESAYNAHPAFQNMFIRSRRRGTALEFERIPRNEGEERSLLLHFSPGGDQPEWETDRSILLGRVRRLDRPDAIPRNLTGALGYTLDPCSALRVRRRAAPGETVKACFVVAATPKDREDDLLRRYEDSQSIVRAMQLVRAQSRAMLRFLGVDVRLWTALQKACQAIIYPAVRPMGRAKPSGEDMTQRELWQLGLSGELPILLCPAEDTEDLPAAREIARAHSFYRAMGVWCDLVYLCCSGSEYHQPLRDALSAIAAASGAGEGPGGVHILEKEKLTPHQHRLLNCAAALTLAGGEPLAIQWDRAVRFSPPDMPDFIPVQGKTAPRDAAFAPDDAFTFNVAPDSSTPAPWMNLCANPDFGMMLSERGGGFLWQGSSRSGRLTAFENDPQWEGFHRRFWLREEITGACFSILPEPWGQSARVRYEPGVCVYEGETEAMSWTLTQFVPRRGSLCCAAVRLEAKRDFRGAFQYEIDWLLASHPAYARLTRAGYWRDLLWARGGIGATAFAQMEGGSCENDRRLTRPVRLAAGESVTFSVFTGTAEDETAWRRMIAGWDTAEELRQVQERSISREMVTPSRKLNAMLNTWLPAQTRMSRILGRTGFYQGGGAIGFRDQLQDMLSLIGQDDEAVRRHLLLCAAHQFPAGDVQHWWHPPRMGVRTHISDDMLFLPYVAAEYLRLTEDVTLLEDTVPYLNDTPIAPGESDWYGDPGVSDLTGTLREHCQRAIDRACRFGSHGLALMGSGDWNDGMDRVGRKGRGESVWLSEFLLVTLRLFEPYADETAARRYRDTAVRLRAALERAWDGKWYLRAYDDAGRPIGSHSTVGGCQIDSVAQTWAVFAGLDRARQAMDAVESRLIDRRNGLIRLLAPPFAHDTGTGYICAYPPGVRENGGQYTHAACWVVMAYARLGEADKAWELFEMIMPYTHADTEEKQNRYRVEPYVMAGDICAPGEYTVRDASADANRAGLAGRGGWTWYTGAASWAQYVALRELFGFEIRADHAVLHPLLPSKWDEISLILRLERSEYRLLCRRNATGVTLDGHPAEGEGIPLVDDGHRHTAVFPPRTTPKHEK